MNFPYSKLHFLRDIQLLSWNSSNREVTYNKRLCNILIFNIVCLNIVHKNYLKLQLKLQLIDLN